MSDILTTTDLGQHVSGSTWRGMSVAVGDLVFDGDGNPVMVGSPPVQDETPVDLRGAYIECQFRSSYRSGTIYAKYRSTDTEDAILIDSSTPWNVFTIPPTKKIVCADVDTLVMDVMIHLAAAPFADVIIYPFAGSIEIIHTVTPSS